MKRLGITLINLLFLAGLYQVCFAWDCCNQTNCIKEIGVQKTDGRRIQFFNSIDIKGSYSSTISCRNNQAIEITCDKNLLPYISTEVKNQKLYIFSRKPICTTKGIKIAIFAPDVVSVDASGSNDISITGINNESISIKLDGSGDLNISGNTKKFDAVLSGSNKLYAKKLRSETTHISIAGSSDASVYASKDLDIDISGVGDIIYYGNPKTILKKISGIGEIKTSK